MSFSLATKSPAHATARGISVAIAVSSIGLAFVAAGAASADDTVVVRVPLDRTASSAPGTTVVLDQVTVDPGLVGRSCDASYRGDNNGSVHPGTDLLITSNGATVVLVDVEGDPGRITTGSSTLTLGPSVQVSVRVGADGFASLGAQLTIVCPASATTTTAAPTTTAEPTTSGPDTSVAVGPPPVPTQPLPSVSNASESTTSTTAVGAAGPTPTPTSAVGSGGPTTGTPTATTISGGPGTPAGGAGGSLPTTGSDPGGELAAALLTLLTGVLLWRIRLPRPTDRLH